MEDNRLNFFNIFIDINQIFSKKRNLFIYSFLFIEGLYAKFIYPYGRYDYNYAKSLEIIILKGQKKKHGEV